MSETKQMKRTVFFLLTFLTFSWVNTMAQLIDFRGQPLLLSNKNGVLHYLTFAEKMEDHYFFSKTGEADIIIRYGLYEESDDQLFRSGIGFEAQFIPDSAGRYKIMQLSTGGNVSYRETVEDDWEDMHFSPSKKFFAGFSDNQSLEAVQALNYLNEHTIEPVIYDNTQVDRQPVFKRGETVVNFEKYISTELGKGGIFKEDKSGTLCIVSIDSLLKTLSGFVRFAFVVRENGEISHLAVDEIKLNNLDAVSDVCAGINNQILYSNTQDYNNTEKYRWKPGEKNGVPVAVRQFVTVYLKSIKRKSNHTKK